MISDKDLLKLRELIVEAKEYNEADHASYHLANILIDARIMIDKLRETSYHMVKIYHPCGDGEWFLLKDNKIIASEDSGYPQVCMALDGLGIEFTSELTEFTEEEFGSYEKAEEAYFECREKLMND